MAPETPLVVGLEALTRADLGLAGGKGANLGELIRAGFPVPPGFVVTAAAYEQFAAHNQLQEALEKGEPRLIRAAFERAPIPPEVARKILTAYDRLGDGPVAVRSSGTAEDLPQAAFAGQHDTF